MSTTKTLFITGVSSGFGQALAHQALAAGHTVIGTLRSEDAVQAFEAQAPGRAHGVLLDVTDFDAIDRVVAEADNAFGPIDVLVNNAGYGHEGVLEESPLEDLRRQFDVNVFGAVAIIKAFVPLFRQRRRGHILNVTSMGGFITMPGISYYHGSKFALEGISESLGKELKPFNVFVTAVAPGLSARIGPGARCNGLPGRLPTTTPASTRSARPVKNAVGSSRGIRSRLPTRCSN